MRFIHTADWQIGMKAAHVGRVGERLREVRLETARKVVEEAGNQNVDFMVVAGDTFEDNAVDRVLVQRTADILAGEAVPVYVIPGNHDPVIPGSVWDHPVWGEQQNIHVLRESEAIEVPGGILFPCPVRDKHSRKDPTSWIQAQDTQGIRIGVAHGTVEGIPQNEPERPIPRNAGVRTGLDYLALGHWHSTAIYEDPPGAVRMTYCGTHEATRFGERDSGNTLLVEIASAGTPPKITVLKTGCLKWMTVDKDLRQPGDLERVRSLLDELENPDRTLLEIRLSGLLSGSDCLELTRLNEVLESRFFYHRVNREGLHPSPEDDTWIEGLSHGVLREAALRLREVANSQGSDDKSPYSSPEVAGQALMELYAIVRGTES